MCDISFIRENFTKIKQVNILNEDVDSIRSMKSGKEKDKMILKVRKNFVDKLVIDILNNYEFYNKLELNNYELIVDHVFYIIKRNIEPSSEEEIKKKLYLTDIFDTEYFLFFIIFHNLFHLEIFQKSKVIKEIFMKYSYGLLYYPIFLIKNRIKIFKFYFNEFNEKIDYTIFSRMNLRRNNKIVEKEILYEIMPEIKFLFERKIKDNTNIDEDEKLDIIYWFGNLDLNEENMEFLHKYKNLLDKTISLCIENKYDENEKEILLKFFEKNLLSFYLLEDEYDFQLTYGYFEDSLDDYYFLQHKEFMKYVDPNYLNIDVMKYCYEKHGVFEEEYKKIISKKESLFYKYTNGELNEEEYSEECEIFKINEKDGKFNIKLKIKDEEHLLPGDNQCLIHHGYIKNLQAIHILPCKHIICITCKKYNEENEEDKKIKCPCKCKD